MFPGIERRLGIADLLASCVTDERTPASTTHTYADMIRARMFAIACGYEDSDDLDVSTHSVAACLLFTAVLRPKGNSSIPRSSSYAARHAPPV